MLHGQDGWELWSYSWGEVTGIAKFVYKRKLEDGTDEKVETERSQPLWPGHAGYRNSLRTSR